VRPFGYEMNGSLRETEADALRGCYKGLLEGRSLTGMAKALNADGILTNRGNQWAGITLRDVLMNPRNAAIRTYKGEEVGPGAWDAVVDEATYRAAVRLMSDPSRHKSGDGKRKAMLSGIATCGGCGGSIVRAYVGRKGDPKGYPIYQCKQRKCVSFQEEFADSVVMRKIIAAMSGEGADRWFAGDAATGSGESVGQLEAKAEAIKARQVELAEGFAAGLVTMAQLSAATQRLNDDLAAVEGELAAAGRVSVLVGHDLEYVWQEFDSEDVERKRAIVKEAVESVSLVPMGKGGRPKVENVVVVLRAG
jgi:hypothetical protein